MHIRDGLGISGRVTINAYRAGMVEAITPYLEAHRSETELQIREYLRRKIEAIKAAYFIRTAVECHNLVMDSPNYGLDLIIQRLIGTNTYSLNIQWIEIGTGATTPALTDTALTTPTFRAAVSYTQDYGTTDAILQCYIPDGALANATYNEVGCFVDGSGSLGSGQIFNHALLTPAYAKVSGQDTTIEIDLTLANS